MKNSVYPGLVDGFGLKKTPKFKFQMKMEAQGLTGHGIVQKPLVTWFSNIGMKNNRETKKQFMES